MDAIGKIVRNWRTPGVLRNQAIASLNAMLNRRMIRTTTLAQSFGADIPRTLVVPSETVDVSEINAVPLFPLSRHLAGKAYVSQDAYVTNLKGVIYCPPGNILLTRGREVLEDSLLPHHQLLSGPHGWNSSRTYGTYGSNGRPYWWNFRHMKVEHVQGCCSVFRGMYEAYFHTLVTEIPRVFLLRDPDVSQGRTVKLLCPGGLSNVERYFLPKLLPPHVEVIPVRNDRLYLIDELIFPSYLNVQSSGYLPSPYVTYFRARHSPERQRRKKNRIFISRKGYQNAWGRRHIVNEDELMSQLGKLGFVSYALEDLPIADQISLFHDAEMVVGAHGSGLTNVLFSECTKVLELNPALAMHPYFFLLSKCTGGRHGFWFGGNTDDPDDKELFVNFAVDVPRVVELVANALAT